MHISNESFCPNLIGTGFGYTGTSSLCAINDIY